ncbi:MAG: FliG C-terminal domain-containing protein [Pseudomonadota bacterium]
MMMPAASRLSPSQRAAVVLVSLEPEQAQPIADVLGLAGMRRIRAALADLPHLSEAEVFAAFADFITQLNAWRTGLRGGEAESLELLTKVLTDTMMEKIRGPREEPPSDTWEEFGLQSPDVIAGYIAQQHPRVAALMLDRLPGDRVPEVLSLMPSDAAVEAINQLSRPEAPARPAVDIAEAMVRRDVLDKAIDPTSDPKIVMLGEALGTLPRDLRDAALARIEKQDEMRADAIRSTLLRIEDIPNRLPTKSVQVVFREVGRDILIKGLAAVGEAAPVVSSFLLGNIAQRMADQFREDIAALPAQDAAAQERAIGNLVREILGLSRRGSLTLLSSSQEDDA